MTKCPTCGGIIENDPFKKEILDFISKRITYERRKILVNKLKKILDDEK